MVYETVRSVLFYLDTRVRSGGTLGSPVFTFPNNLINLQPQNGEQIKLTMQEASMEYTFYQTEDFNNKFLVREVTSQATLDRVITIEIGNYNLITFVKEITEKLNAGSLYKYVIIYVPETNTLRYTASPLVGSSVSIQFNYNADEVFLLTGAFIGESTNEIMGFGENEVVDFVLNITTGELEAQSTIPITMAPGVENLYVTIQNTCSNFGNANAINVFSSSNILAKIPVSNPPFSTLYFYDLNGNFSTIIQNKYIDNLNVTLFNERFTQIEPRKDWTFTIKIDIIRPHASQNTEQHLNELLELEKIKFLKKNESKTS